MRDENFNSNWKSCEIGEISDRIHYGYTATAKPVGSGSKYLRITDIQNGHVDWASVPICDITLEEFEKFRLFENDLVFARTGGTVGKSFLLKKQTPENAVFASYLIRVIINKNVFPKYIYYFFQSLNYWSQIELNKTGLKTNVNAQILSRLKFNLAPLPEQRAIVAKIEQLFSELDNGIANLKAAKDKLEIYRQAVLKKAFEGELTKEWREQNKTESAFDFLKSLAFTRKKEGADKKSIYHKKVSHDFNFSQDEHIPTWAKGTLDKLIYIAARIGWRGLKKSEYTEAGPLFLSVHSLNYGKNVDFSEAFHISEERYLESPEIQLQARDVLLCKDGAGIGKIGIIKNLKEKSTVNSSILVIRGMEVLNQEFLYYLFSGPRLQSIVFERITGSATPHLFQNDIRKFELSIPPIEEQTQIVQEIESRLSVCDNILANIKEGLEKSEALRQSILKQAFEGKLLGEAELEACRKEPDWEPAEQLLERIKNGEKVESKKVGNAG